MICEPCQQLIGAAGAVPPHLEPVKAATRGERLDVAHYCCRECGTLFSHQPAFGATTLAWLMINRHASALLAYPAA